MQSKVLKAADINLPNRLKMVSHGTWEHLRLQVLNVAKELNYKEPRSLWSRIMANRHAIRPQVILVFEKELGITLDELMNPNFDLGAAERRKRGNDLENLARKRGLRRKI